MQEEDYQWFLENMPDLYKKYGQTFLIIKEKQVVGGYSTYEDALNSALQTLELGSFLVQQCFEKKSQTVNFFQGNNVHFRQGVCK
jgi:hypothetical protein